VLFPGIDLSLLAFLALSTNVLTYLLSYIKTVVKVKLNSYI